MLAKLNKMKYFSILLLAAGMLFLQTSDAHAVDASYQEALFAHMLATEIGNAKHQESIEMVANVVTNRVKYYRQYDPNVNVTDVLLQKGQFVGIHRDLIGSTEQLLADIKKRCPGQWRTLLEISRAAINGTLPDRTNGALNYNKSSKRNAGETSKVTDKHCLYNDKPNCTTVNHYFYSSHLGRLKHNPKYSGGDHIGEFSEEELANITVPDSSNENPTEPDYVEPEECKTASTEQATVSADISGGGLFDAAILTNMNNMMVNIYKTLGRLYMLGHGLICYSTKVAPVEIMNVIKLVRLNYWIPGALIYMTAFFLSMSIGMYFIDISFKLGFAVLFLPVSIGLWPFPPTKDKFLQNINIVIHNAMLFACAAIGITYAVKLIEEGVTGGAGGIEEFWQFIDSAERVQTKLGSSADEAFISNNMENFTKRFAIDTTNILVILFCLFFAFKIVGVSVANYLNRFFGEGSLGSAEHAMHHMGTQALGFATSHTIGAAGKWARDVAFTQAGRGLKNLGGHIASLAPNSKFQGTTSAGGGAGGSGGAGGPTPNTNGGPTGGPIPFNTEQQNKDNQGGNQQNTNSQGGNQQNTDNQGGNQQNTNNQGGNQQNTNNQGGNQQNTNNQGGNQQNTNNQGGNQQNTNSQGGNQQNTDNQGGNQQNTNNQGGNQQNTNNQGDNQQNTNNQGGNQQNTNSQGGNQQNTNSQGGNQQNTNNQGGKPTSNNNGGNNQGSNQQNTNNQGDNNGGIKGRMVNMKTTVVNYTRPTAHSLTVGNAFKAIRHPQQAYRTVKRLAQQGQQDWQNADGVKDKGKLILKKSGQVVLRSVRGNVVEAASGTTKVMGGFLNFLGDAMEKAPQKWQNERQQNQQNQEYEDNQQRRQQEREAEWGMDNAERY